MGRIKVITKKKKEGHCLFLGSNFGKYLWETRTKSKETAMEIRFGRCDPEDLELGSLSKKQPERKGRRLFLAENRTSGSR